jgi:hypothetical protein
VDEKWQYIVHRTIYLYQISTVLIYLDEKPYNTGCLVFVRVYKLWLYSNKKQFLVLKFLRNITSHSKLIDD